MRRLSAAQVALPYDVTAQTTREYPVPQPPKLPKLPQPVRHAAQLVDEPEINIDWERGEPAATEIERTLADLAESVPADAFPAKLAHGSGPAPVETPMVATGERARAKSRPSMAAVLAGELEAESDLEVPTFIRRHAQPCSVHVHVPRARTRTRVR